MKLLQALVRKHADISSVLFLGILCLIFFARLFYPEPQIFSTAEIGINDIWYINFPLKNLGENFKMGKIPAWNPYRSGGFPDLAESQAGTYNLYNLLTLTLLPTIQAFNFGYVVIFFTTALGTYLFVKRQKFNAYYAFLAAFTYAFSGFFITHISHFLLIQTASFFPWLLYFTDVLLKDKKASIPIFFALALTLSQQIFSGNPQTVFISCLAVLGYVCFVFLIHKTTIKRILITFLALFLGVGISAAQLLPTLELMQLSTRGSGLGITELLFYKYPLKHLITMVFPFWFGNPQIGTYPHFRDFNGSLFWENTGYVGLLPLVFTTVCLIYFIKHQSKKVFFYIFSLVVSLLLMAGGDGPLYFILTLPPFSFFRFPSRFMIIFLFSLVLLSTYGLKYLIEKLRKSRRFQPRLTLFKTLVFFLIVADIFIMWFHYHPTAKYREFATPPPISELLQKSGYNRVYAYLQNSRAFQQFFEIGSSQPNYYLELRNELAPNLNVYYHTPTVDYYSSLIPRRLLYFNYLFTSSYHITTASATLDHQMERRLNLRSVSHIISPIPLLNTSLILQNKLNLNYELGNLYLYKNRNALPKYYLVNKFKYADTLEDLFVILDSSDFDYRHEAIIEKNLTTPINAQELPNGKIKVLAETNDTLQLEIETDQSAVLVITNTYYPGWQVKIDGRISQVFPVNLVNQGILIEKGKHTVETAFISQPVIIGQRITFASYAIIAIYFVIKFGAMVLNKGLELKIYGKLRT